MNSSAIYIVAINDALIRLLLKMYLTDELQNQPDWNPSALVVIFGTGTLVTYGRSAVPREWLRSKDFGRLSVADLWIVSCLLLSSLTVSSGCNVLRFIQGLFASKQLMTLAGKSVGTQIAV